MTTTDGEYDKKMPGSKFTDRFRTTLELYEAGRTCCGNGCVANARQPVRRTSTASGVSMPVATAGHLVALKLLARDDEDAYLADGRCMTFS